MSKRENIEHALSKLSYGINAQKKLIQLSIGNKPLATFHLEQVKTFIDYALMETLVVGSEIAESRMSQVATAFLELYRKRYPTSKKNIRDFNADEKKSLKQLLDMMDSLNERYPEAKLNYQRYLKIHFFFYAHNFGTAPKISFFATDNAAIRADHMLEYFDGEWPGEEQVDEYFKQHISPASPKAKAREDVKANQKPTQDIRLTGLQIWTTNLDKETQLKDNSKFLELKNKVLRETATIYEARYVRDCYHIRNSADTMPNEIDEYILKLESLAQNLGINLK